MTLSRWMTGVALAVFFTVPAVAAQTDKAEVALRAATEKETVEGDVKGAIEQYKKLAQNSNKSVAARALVRLGECYEKQGSADARKTYEQVLSKFGDQTEAVGQARARLAAIGGGQTGQPTTRLVWTDDHVWTSNNTDGTVSPDGRYVSFVVRVGNLALHDLVSGTDRLLTNSAIEQRGESAYARGSVISRDGKQVAFEWFDEKNGGHSELRLANLAGDPNPRHLFENTEIVRISPYDWSPDGKSIVATLARKDKNSKAGQIGLIATQGGSLHILNVLGLPGRIHFSPDGKYLAYDRLASEAGRSVYILAIDGGSESQVALSTGQRNNVVGWSPDGKQLLFASDGGLWALPIAGGKPQSAPALIKAGFDGTPMGITAKGALFFGNYGSDSQIRVTSVDLSTGKRFPQPDLPFHASNASGPAWSPDGKYLAWLPRSSSASQGVPRITIRMIETGLVRDLKLPGPCTQPSWAPDGRSLACTTQTGLSRIDAQTGQITSIVSSPDAAFYYRGPQFSPDGKKVYYLKVPKLPSPATDGAIAERDLASGSEREVFHGQVYGAWLSPDGRYFACDGGHNSATNMNPAFLIPVSGGDPREVFSYPRPNGGEAHGWTPDSRNLIAWTWTVGSSPEAWLYPIDGGTRRKLDIDTSGEFEVPGFVRVHPDGRQVAYTITMLKLEVSVLENFLPPAKATK